MKYRTISILLMVLVTASWLLLPASNKNEEIKLEIKPRWNQTNWLLVVNLTNQSNHRYGFSDAAKEPAWNMNYWMDGRTNNLSPTYGFKSSVGRIDSHTNETWTIQVPAKATRVRLSLSVIEISRQTELISWFKRHGSVPNWYPSNNRKEQELVIQTNLPSPP